MKRQLQPSMNVDQIDNEELNGDETQIEVDGTPFRIVKIKEDIYAVTLGREVLKIKSSVNECKGYIKTKPWELILNAAAVYIAYVEESRKEEEAEIETEAK